MTSKINRFFGIFFNQKSPWENLGENLGGNNSGGNNDSGNSGDNNQDPWSRPQRPNPKPSDHGGKKLNPNPIDEIFAGLGELFKGLSGEGSGGGNKGGKKGGSGNAQKSIFGLIIIGLIVLWLASGIYKVNSDENGLVLYFGKFHSISTPGLNYRIPAPFSKVIIRSVEKVNTEEFSFNNPNQNSKRRSSRVTNENQSLMLTGDENIVDIDFQIQWQISDIQDFVFNLEDPQLAIRKASESAIREIIARTPIADALSDGKRRIEQETKELLQTILDSYGAGVRIVLVQMQRVDPPAQVINAFRDVQTAKADKEREINQAQSYQNDIIPRAKGEAAKILEEAKAYKQEVIAISQGEASRFNAIYAEYSRARTVTKKRLYLEQMEKIYRNIDKVIIDKNISKTGAIPYLPINSKNQNK